MDDQILNALDAYPKDIQNRIKKWITFNKEVKQEIIHLLKEDPDELIDAFSQDLSFGTAGARAIMGIGPNRMNIYTIRKAAQGLANILINEHYQPTAVISFDTRNHSETFAHEFAKVLAANNVHVYLFKNPKPTPLLSFALRKKNALSGVMVTASHNPPEYNGFKIFWKDGAQVTAPEDKKILDAIHKIDFDHISLTPEEDKLIETIDIEMDDLYLQTIKNYTENRAENVANGDLLSILYSNLHGTGYPLVPRALESWGFHNLSLVDKQKNYDGYFTYAKPPNPEDKNALKLGIDIMLNEEKDLFIATDPDADRMAAVVNHHGESKILSGNQIACILLHHIFKTKKIPENAAFIKSIVTTDLFEEIVKDFDKTHFSVLTGFKYIASMILKWEETKEHTFIFGAEESFGYLFHDDVRDKDSITASCLIAEAAFKMKKEGKTLYDGLLDLYKTYGIYREKQISFNFEPGIKGMKLMKNIMSKLRNNADKIGNLTVAYIEDYLTDEGLDVQKQCRYRLTLPKSNVLLFRLTDHSKIVIRPSGTEPKLKIYLGVVEKSYPTLEEGIKIADARLEALSKITATEITSSQDI